MMPTAEGGHALTRNSPSGNVWTSSLCNGRPKQVANRPASVAFAGKQWIATLSTGSNAVHGRLFDDLIAGLHFGRGDRELVFRRF